MNIGKIKEFFSKFFRYSIVAIIFFLAGMLVSLMIREASSMATSPTNEVSMAAVKVVWNPGDEQVLLIDRKTNATILVLSKEVTNAVFSLKASAIQQDFTSVTSGGVVTKQPQSKKTTPTK